MGKSGNLCGRKDFAFSPPPHCRWGFRPSSLPLHRPAAPRLAVFGCPSAPWPDVPAPRIPKSARPDLMQGPGAPLPPRVPAPAKCLGVRQPPPGFRASRASMGSWGFAGRCPQWRTASSSGAAELESDGAIWGEGRTMSTVALVLFAALLDVIFPLL